MPGLLIFRCRVVGGGSCLGVVLTENDCNNRRSTQFNKKKVCNRPTGIGEDRRPLSTTAESRCCKYEEVVLSC